MAPLSEGIFCADYALTALFKNHSYTVFNDTLDDMVQELGEAMAEDGYSLADLIDGHVFRTARKDDPSIVCLLDIVVEPNGTWSFADAADPARSILADM